MRIFDALRRSRLLAFGIAGLALAAVAGCGDDDDPAAPDELAPPTSLSVVNGNQTITVNWNASPDEGAGDFKGYNIYRHTASIKDLPLSQLTQYRVASVEPGDDSYTLTNVPNGTRYYIHVRSETDGGEISDASTEVQGAAREEGTGIILEEFASDGDSGFDFSEGESVSLSQDNDQRFQKTDIYLGTVVTDDAPSGELALKNPKLLERYNTEWSTVVGKVRRLGTNWDVNTTDTDGANWLDQEQVSSGFVYAVKTPDNHYGKIQILGISGTAPNRSITFKYAWQPTANLVQF